MILQQINNFFEATTIHGFAYISKSQQRTTRIIWTLLVFAALGGASYILYHTVEGFGDKFVSTTIETRSIHEFPFPAVTFHPGDYNSKNAFLRSFLNQFEFTRYYDDAYDNPLRSNEKFSNIYSWLVKPMQNEIFDDIEKHLIEEKMVKEDLKGYTSFLQSKERMFKNEICAILSLQKKNVSMKEDVRQIFASNMYKFWRFPDLMNLIRLQEI